MRKEKKYMLAGLAGVITILCIIALSIGYGYYTSRIKESELYVLMSSFQKEKKEEQFLEAIPFSEGSAEQIFLSGMDAFIQKDYEKAKLYFEEALLLPASDPALAAYLNYYYNECIFILEGMGDFSAIGRALDAIVDYAPLSKDISFVKGMMRTVIHIDNMEEVSGFIEACLEKQKKFQPIIWANLMNIVGALRYQQEEYARSIRNFYDVQILLSKEKPTPQVLNELVYAEEYIANIYYLFEDYENAIRLYQELIDQNEDPLYRVTAYVNMSAAYLELEDTKSARDALEELKRLISAIDSIYQKEAEACYYNTLGNICMAEGNFSGAISYIEAAESYYQSEQGEELLFLGSKYFTILSKCRYMIHVGEIEEAISILEAMTGQREIVSYGMEVDIYELLLEAYVKLENKDKILETYKFLLEYDKIENQRAKQEYLEFSRYYRDARGLEQTNERLHRFNVITTFAVIVFIIVSILFIFMIHFLWQRDVTDQLTGVYNRKKLNSLQHKFKRSGTPGRMGLIMLDIDYFKKYNDTYGHPEGDKALREVATVLKSSVRSCDTVIRYGGEEFLIILDGVEAKTAGQVCQRISTAIQKAAIPHKSSEISDYLTLSMGVCCQKKEGSKTLTELITAADECLYQSKKAGRNQYTLTEM